MAYIQPFASRLAAVAVFTVATVFTAPQAGAQAPAALAQAPQGADLVFIVPSMSQFSGKLAMLNQTLELDSPEMTDALAAFKAEMGIADGLNDAGSALVVIQDLSVVANDEDPDILFILPVTDYQAFIESFQGVDADNDQIAELIHPDGQSGFARESGGYVVMGDSLESVRGYAPGGDADAVADRIGELGQHYLKDCDAAIYLDLEALAPMLTVELDKVIAQMQGEMGQAAEMGIMGASDLEMVQAVFTLYASAGKAVLTGSQGVLFSLDISEDGIGLTDAIAFKPDSPILKYFPGGDGKTVSILSRLPKGSYLFAGSLDLEAIAAGDLFENALAQLPEGNAQIDQARKALPIIRQVRQAAGVFYTPDQAALMGGGSPMNVLSTSNVNDSAEYLKLSKDNITSMNGTSIPMANPMGGQPMAATYTTSYTDNALQLDGVQVDQYSMQVQMPQEMIMMMGPMAGFMQMFTNFNGYIAEDDGHVLQTTTLDQQLIAKALATGKTGDGLGSADTLAKIRDKAIPPGAAFEGYVSLAGIAETASPFAMMFGLPGFEAPVDLPPIGLGLGIKDEGAAARLYVPNKTIKYVIDTAKDVQAQMMGGPGGPGGPGAQPQGPGAPPPPF